MDYKKIFRSRKLRHRILKALSFIPDKTMVKLQYRIKFGCWPDFKNPKKYNEKIQLYKLYYRNPDMTICSDKFAVRQYLTQKGFGDLLPELYGVYDKAEDIYFDRLPDKFVIKTNDGSGGNNIIICKDKSKLDYSSIIKEVNSWLNLKNLNPGREWAYNNIPKSLIIIEEYLENPDDPGGGIEDYKFFCFDGKIEMLQYDEGRYGNDHRRNFYDTNWNDIHVVCGKPNTDRIVPKPKNFEKMKEIAVSLSKGFPHVRVDLYSVRDKIYFGELTFYTGSGYSLWLPKDYEFELGMPFDISSFYPPKK